MSSQSNVLIVNVKQLNYYRLRLYEEKKEEATTPQGHRPIVQWKLICESWNTILKNIWTRSEHIYKRYVQKFKTWKMQN